MIGLGIFLGLIGMLLTGVGVVSEPFASSGIGPKTFNLGLAQQRELAVYSGLILFSCGALLAGLGSVRNAVLQLTSSLRASAEAKAVPPLDRESSVRFRPPSGGQSSWLPIAVQDRVRHPLYGEGVVVAVINGRPSVRFDRGPTVEVGADELMAQGSR